MFEWQKSPWFQAEQNRWRAEQMARCPCCHLRWQADRGVSFNGLVVCPLCLTPSRPGPGGRKEVAITHREQTGQEQAGLPLFMRDRGGR